jgi:sulfite dehydrogenase
MTPAYRIPDNDCNCVQPGTAPAKTKPIGRFKVRSFITSVQAGATIKPGPQTLSGIAFDGGTGVKAVELSIDDGKTWLPTTLGADAGRYAFRGWTAPVTLPPGAISLKVRAISNAGETQPVEQPWNPAGYLRNLVETTTVRVA